MEDLGELGEQPSNAGPSQTFMASHVEVSNGFVKNGTSLPYVIETNKSGNKKRSSKILPVCGICRKKFVCVTTMKRHLVTHTGERPFNCKVCGKQYTQKGNLRVHERTHRNDRPFGCNICHQRFYRKEPMQKHQWRQHGIGHYKSRPSGSDGPALGIIGAEGVLYNSFVERTKPETEGTDQKFAPVYEVPEAAAHTEVDNFSEDEDVQSTQSISRVVTRYINDSAEQPEQKKSLEVLSIRLLDSAPESLVPHQIDNNNHQQPPEQQQQQQQQPPPPQQPQVEDSEDIGVKQLKMKLAQAYLKEVKENREREEKDGRDNEGRDSFGPVTVLAGLEENLSDIKLTKNTEASRPVQPEHPEYVECFCKSCGSKCLVSDPYNFSCKKCQVKYTSLPTHMIADPLQCIGCLKTFDHKPAMKEHQSSNDKERPFVCCQCGYEFKQKAHLQKHQWRIHRRKLDPDPNVKEAEAILKAVNEIRTPTTSPRESDSKITIQQIIDRGIEEEMSREEPAETGAPLDLSPGKMHMVSQWLQQVETARTPIVPDISILPREPLLLSQLRPQSESVSVTIKLLEPQTTKHYAVKSKPAVANLDPVQNSSWRNSSRDNNPLLNQKSLPEEMSNTGTILYLDRGHKRVRTELTDTPQTIPADLSINQKLDFSPPSPPLNLSSKHRVQQEDLPFDYRISRSDLITGQLARMRSQDERSGI